jgi:hypothetical protein
MADKSAEITELETIANSSLDQVTVDGVTTKFSQETVAKRLRALRAADDTEYGRRPVAARIKLN